MLSIAAVLGIAAAVAIFILAVGVTSVIKFLRHRHRVLMCEDGLGLHRGLSTYHRAHLSIDSGNYGQIPEPRTRLRQSTYMPYGVISQGWAPVPSQENLNHPNVQQMSTIIEQPDAEATPSPPKRRRSLRNSFYAHSFSVPKTRRQKKIEKAIPLSSMPRSPLSAITERSGSNNSDKSPVIGVAELATENRLQITPEKGDEKPRIPRPQSAQRPLAVLKSRSEEAVPTLHNTAPYRNSTVVRPRSISGPRPSMGQRSISMASTFSVPPDDPLPPLPSVAPSHYQQRRKSNIRFSTASFDTVASSVLGAGLTSPSQTATDFTSISLASPIMDCLASAEAEITDNENSSENCDPAALTMVSSPGTQTKDGYRSGNAAIDSFRASIGNQSLLKTASISQVPDQHNRNSLIPRPTGSTMTIIDASSWRPGLSSQRNSFRTSLSPSLPAPVARLGSDYRRGASTARHSMFEQHSGSGILTLNPSVLQQSSGNQNSPLCRQSDARPASVSSSNPFQWDQNTLPAAIHPLKNSAGSQRKGHKRQNCVRISNLPTGERTRRKSKLPQMAEEDEGGQLPATPGNKESQIPGLVIFAPQAIPNKERTPSQLAQPSPSPFLNRPILAPTPRPKGPAVSRASSTESSGSSRPDSDFFSKSEYNPEAPNIFASAACDRQWPSSPTPQNHIEHPTPPALRAIKEPYVPQSPILPSPNLSSAILFPRDDTKTLRKSVVQGPRKQSAPSRFARNGSPSPLNGRMTKKHSGNDLRRSVMMLRRMNSEADRDEGLSKSNHSKEDPTAASSPRNMSKRSSQSSFENAESRIAKTSSHQKSALLSAEKADRSVSGTTFLGEGLSQNEGMMHVAPSPSLLSTGGASIWEDASILEEEDGSPRPPALLPASVNQLQSPIHLDTEAFENFVGQDRKRMENATTVKPLRQSSRLNSPQGKGLGLMGLGTKVWGTPASLYDREGFLKD